MTAWHSPTVLTLHIEEM